MLPMSPRDRTASDGALSASGKAAGQRGPSTHHARFVSLCGMTVLGQTASDEVGLLATARRECIERGRSLLVRWVSRSRVRHPGYASPTRRTTMEIEAQAMPSRPRRELWNKGKLIGQKPPLRPKHVWSIRTRLQIEGRTRDLAMFNLAIDSKLRGCDVVAIRVEDVAPSGYAVDRATVRQRKTSRPVRFELTEQTRQAPDDYIKVAGRKTGEFLFSSRRRAGQGMTTRQYARLVNE